MVQRRRLRAELQRARETAGLTQRQVAHDLGWSLSKLIRVENGQVGVSRTDLKALLERYEISDPQVVSGYVLMAEQGRRQRWSAYKGVLNSAYLAYLEYEGSASSLRQFQNLVVPGLLQTEQYATALSLAIAPDADPDVLARQLEVRLHRQRLLGGDPAPQMHFVVDEAALRRRVERAHGDPTVMRGQFARLAELSTHPHITLQVIPFDRGPYDGMQVPFTILGFPDAEDTDLLFREDGNDSAATRGDQRTTGAFAETFNSLSGLALPPAAVPEFLDHLLADITSGGVPGTETPAAAVPRQRTGRSAQTAVPERSHERRP